MNPITVSVIVPAFNASATIGKMLEGLSRQNCFQPFEVIVVDDGSSDNTGEIVCSFKMDSRFRGNDKEDIGNGKEGLKYIRQDNAGPAAARNHGAKLARGEYLVFTDSDCIPHEDWISQLMAGFGSPQVGVVSGSYGIANPENVLAGCIYKEILWRHTSLMPDFPNSFGSYNFCVKKNVFEAVGGFNTDYRHASGEDNDLSYKIIQSGWRIYFQRKALVDHYHPTLVIKYLKEQFRHGFWRLKMYQDHPRMMRGDGYTYWKDIVEMPLVLVLLGGVFWIPAFAGMTYHGTGMTGALIDAEMVTLLGFLIFEIVCAWMIVRVFFDGIFFGFVLLFRAFARMFGLSTGILCLLFKKKEKIFH